MGALPDKDYRFAVFDFEFTNGDGMHVSKLIFVNWCADGSPMKTKILYATAKEAFKKYLDTLGKDYTMSPKGNVNYFIYLVHWKGYDQRTWKMKMKLFIVPIERYFGTDRQTNIMLLYYKNYKALGAIFFI